MFAGQLISNSIPSLHPDDTVATALQEMNDFHVSHLAVADEGRYMGIVSEEMLLDMDESAQVEILKADLPRPFVRQNDSFLLAVRIAKKMHLSVVPVVSEQYELLGAISEEELFTQLAAFCGIDENGGFIILEMEKQDFSAGELNRLVESNDAYITQLNTQIDTANQLLIVSLRINKAEISDIVATLQRHEYTIRYYFGEELYQNELQSNLDHLMNYLNI
ncbi:MAG: CBS domain-containing protein [Chitinophagaceae bacterium]|nr:CBS domain-containing protein [Chitinophagaceae bacterium]MCW5929609.1 CBS domain-containing protein [Chitinophagaceae bacterium]